jgi:uncharacterized protein YqeY
MSWVRVPPSPPSSTVGCKLHSVLCRLKSCSSLEKTFIWAIGEMVSYLTVYQKSTDRNRHSPPKITNMTLKEKINADFMDAFKSKEMDRKNFLGVVKGEIQNEEGRSGNVNDEVVLGILRKMEKSLKQTNTEESLKELEYIKPYLPQLMSRDEIVSVIKEMSQNGHDNVSKIMRQFNTVYKGKADNSIVSEVAKEIFY